MKLSRNGQELRGRYRYGDTFHELTLSGSIDDSGVFELEEKNEQNVVTGKLKGVFWNPDQALGTWWSPDDVKQFPFKLESGQEYVDTVKLVSGARVYPVYREYRNASCGASVRYPQLAGTRNKPLEAAANQALRSFGQGEIDASFCAHALEFGEGLRDLGNWTSDRGYYVMGIKPPYVGLRIHETSFDDHGITVVFGDYDLGAGYAGGRLLLGIPAADAYPHFDKPLADVVLR